MAHCYYHALSSVRKWGGTPDDYIELHQWFDEVQEDRRRSATPRATAPCRRHLHARYMDMQAALFRTR